MQRETLMSSIRNDNMETVHSLVQESLLGFEKGNLRNQTYCNPIELNFLSFTTTKMLYDFIVKNISITNHNLLTSKYIVYREEFVSADLAPSSAVKGFR